MNSKNLGTAAKRMTAILSAIAASSFSGLPALAQTSSDGTVQCVPATSRSSQSSSSSTDFSSTNRAASNPADTTANSTNATVNSATDAGTPGIRNFPNQTDPRAVPPASQGTLNNTTGTSSDSTSGMGSSMSGAQMQGSGATSPATDPSVAPTGRSTDRFTPNVGRTGNQTSSMTGQQSQMGMDQGMSQSSASRNPADSADPSIQGSPNQSMTRNGATIDSSTSGQGNVSSGIGTSSGAGGVNSADPSSYTPRSSSGQSSQSGVGGSIDSTSRTGGYYSSLNSGMQPLYGNILGRGGSTNGGGARIRVEVANNPNWVPGGRGDTLTSYFDQAQSGDNQLSANAMNLNNQSSSQPSNIQTEGVTSGGQAANPSSTSAYDAGSTTMSGQSSSSMTNNTASVVCPPGMVPVQSRSIQQPASQQYSQPSAPNQPGADNALPGRAFPNIRQTPQTNP